MARLLGDKYKPPMLILEYREGYQVEQPKTTGESWSFFGWLGDIATSVVDTVKKGWDSLFGKKGQDQIQVDEKKTIMDAANVQTNDVNKSLNYANNKSKGGLSTGACMKDLLMQADSNRYLRQGYAAIRKGTESGGTEPSYSSSLLKKGDTRPHIRVAKTLVGAGPPCNDTNSVVWVRPGKFRDSNPTSNDELYNGSPGDIVRYYRKNKGIRIDAPSTESGDNNYRVIILDEAKCNKYTYPDPTQGVRYCVVRYYAGWTPAIENGNTIKLEHPVQQDEKKPLDVKGQVTDNNPNAPSNTQQLPKKIWSLDFYKIATHEDNFGFGIEKFNFGGDSRKSVQQTRGTISKNGDEVENNFFVDTWWKGPETITLTGVVELPNGYETQVLTLDDGGGEKTVDSEGSVLDALENFFKWNNTPQRVSRGDYMVLRDLYRKQQYKVTFKSRQYNHDVSRQSLVGFQLDFVVLKSAKKIKD